MAVDNFEDKRRYPRFQCKTPLRYKIRGESRFKDVETFDLGLGGVSFHDSSFLPMNTPLRMEINLPYKTLRSEGKIVWTSAIPHSDSYHLGVEFSGVKENDLDSLYKFLNHQQLY